MNGARRSCRRHRSELIALLDDPLGERLRPAARAHLDACAACRAEFGRLVLAGFALRRALATASGPEPSTHAWRNLKARVERRQPDPGRAASPVLGLALAASLAVALMLPLGAFRVGGATALRSPAAIHEAGLDPAAILAAGRQDAEGEARWLRAMTLAGKEASSGERPNRARVELIRLEITPEPDRRTTPPRSYLVSVQ